MEIIVEKRGVETAVGNSPPFLTNLPFHYFAKTVNHELWFKYLAKS